MDRVLAMSGSLVSSVAGALGGIGVGEQPAQFIAGMAVIAVIALAVASVWAVGALGVRTALGKR